MASLMKLFRWSFRSDEPYVSTRTGGATTTRVACNPETGVGLLAAVASSQLRVVSKPVRTGKHGIMAMTPELCCNGACSCGTLDAAAARVSNHLPFCTRGCRFDHFMEALYHKRHWELTGRPLGDRIAADDVRTWLVPDEEEEFFRKLFFCRR